MALGSPTAGAPGTSSYSASRDAPLTIRDRAKQTCRSQVFFFSRLLPLGKKSDPFLIALRKAPSKPSDEERPDFGTQQQVAKEGD